MSRDAGVERSFTTRRVCSSLPERTPCRISSMLSLVSTRRFVQVRCSNAARAFFGERGRGYSLYTLADRDEDLVAAADANGFQPGGAGPLPLMTIEAPPASVHLPPGMAVERVTTTEQVAAVANICSDAYAVYGMPTEVAPLVMSPPSVVLDPHVVAYLLTDADGPVATAQAVAAQGAAVVIWVATRQRAFGRGAGGAMTEAATMGGFQLGASYATLIASPMGAPVYRRLGWSDVGSVVTRTSVVGIGA